MENHNLNTIKTTIEEFFNKATFAVEVEAAASQNNAVLVNIKTQAPNMLIGQQGRILSGIQHLLRAILRKKIEGQFYLDIDINEYKKKKIGYLREIAQAAADEVIFSGKEHLFSPMPDYQRRIIHLTLADRKDVVSKSVGEGEERRIIIKPVQ